MRGLDSNGLTLENIKQALTHPLPGMDGHITMAPTPVDGRPDRWTIPDNCREAGVLLLLYPYATDGQAQSLYIALTRRHEYQGVHSGQISFPGGRREKGESLRRTALRETREEIGILPDTLEIIGQLSSLYTPPSNFCIYPFVAYSTISPEFHPDSREVAELIEVPLGLLLDPTTRRAETWHFEKYGPRQVPFFEISGHKVWGATAMILGEFLMQLRSYQTIKGA